MLPRLPVYIETKRQETASSATLSACYQVSVALLSSIFLSQFSSAKFVQIKRKKRGMSVLPRLKSINSCLGANLSRATKTATFQLRFIYQRDTICYSFLDPADHIQTGVFPGICVKKYMSAGIISSIMFLSSN